MRVFVTLLGTGRGILTLRSAFGLEADHEAGKALLATLEKKLEAYEVILSKQKYLAGNVRASFLLAMALIHVAA